MTPEFAELRRLAEAATPGPWSTAAFQLVIDVAQRIDVGMCGHRDDAAYIAAANPAVVLALLDKLDAAEARLAAIEATDKSKLSIQYGWLTYEVGEHTCGGYGPESNYMHEPGCGYEPLLRLDDLTGWPAAELDALNGQLFDAGYRCGELLAENRALAAKVERVRALHRPAYNDVARSPMCEDCGGKAGVHPCGCWAEDDYEFVCSVCNQGTKNQSVPWPCPTIAALDEEAQP